VNGPATDINEAISQIVRKDRGRLLAALIAGLKDFALAEECLQEALISALNHWGRQGLPRSPEGWILQTARRKAIDRLRRDQNFRRKSEQVAYLMAQDERAAAATQPPEIPDERLRLIFACCHPALAAKTRVALTLRTLGGLSTLEVARAFLDTETAMGQRLSRARVKITKAGIPLTVPGVEYWQDRLGSVLTVIYLIYNEGYSATSGTAPMRIDLCEEALYLARLMDRLQAHEPEIEGLLALILLTHARRDARLIKGAIVPLDEQNRGLWHQHQITEGTEILTRALGRGQGGPFQIQAAIGAVHSEAIAASETRWVEIHALYQHLKVYDSSSVIRLNEAVALSYVQSASAALPIVLALEADLVSYQPYHATCADLYWRTGQINAALSAYDAAIALSTNETERAFLAGRKARARLELTT
jgi:RNA polymerase sigma-70 factor (ECF subfamily)